MGIEFTAEAGHARRFVAALRDQGILAKDTHGTIIRFAPPLIINRDEIDWALARIAAVLT